MNRRQFLKSALFTTIGAVVLSACKKVATTTKSLVDKVSTRTFLKGKKEEISVLGFGAMRLPIVDGVETNIDVAKTEEMVAYAMDLAEEQLRNGTASSQVITHFLKLGMQERDLELERLRHENELIKAKTESIQTGKELKALYADALVAMSRYRPSSDNEG